MSQGLCGARVHQCEMFSILPYVVKLVIKPSILAPLLDNWCCNGNHFVPLSLMGHPHVISRDEVDVTTHNRVMAHFTCIHYIPV